MKRPCVRSVWPTARADGIKILGTGELTKKLTLVVSAISASAKTKVEAKGGSVELIVKKPPAQASQEAAAPAGNRLRPSNKPG